jgi:regulator of sigma E protease
MWLVDNLVNILIFIAVLSVLVISHEFGHFIVARLRGVRVEKFAIGFGPVLFRKKIGETDFFICIVPLGGFVKLAGDQRDTASGGKDEFLSKSPGIRSQIVFAGPLFNCILAFVIIWGLFSFGMPYKEYLDKPVVGKLIEDSAAAQAGLQEGDEITSINDTQINQWEDIPEIVRSSQDELNLTIMRDNNKKEITLKPEIKPIKDMFGREKEKVPQIGIERPYQIKQEKHNVFFAFFYAFKRLLMLAVVVLKGLFYIITGYIPATEGLAGPIALYQITTDIAQRGFKVLLNFVSSISVMLAVVNLLPIPVLDGGHIFLLFIEKIRKQPLNERTEDILVKVGIVLLAALMLFVISNDILRIISGN